MRWQPLLAAGRSAGRRPGAQEFLHPYVADQPARQIGRRLRRDGIIAHFNFKHELFTLARLYLQFGFAGLIG